MKHEGCGVWAIVFLAFLFAGGQLLSLVHFLIGGP